MAQQQLLSTGIKINVDATDLDVKFAKSAEALNRTLTKSQKSLGLFYNEQRQLVNSQGQVVEGLSQAQIKLGYYVDELGRTRTYQGGFTDGLNASQKAMGWFSDELGNIYNQLGELVIETQKATQSLNDLNDEIAKGSDSSTIYNAALKDMTDGADKALGSLSQLAGQTSQLFATIQAATGENDAFTSSIIAASQGVTTFIETYGAVVGVMQYMDALRRATIAQTVATEAATAAQIGLNTAMKANPVGLIVGGLAAITAAVATYKSTAKESSESMTGAFADVEAAARRAGDSIKNAADLARFASASGPKGYAELTSEFNRIQSEQARQQAIVDAGPNWYERGFLGVGAQGVQANAIINQPEQAVTNAEDALEALAERENEVGNALVDMRKQLLNKAREAVATETQKLEAEKANYAAMLKDAQSAEEAAMINAYIAQLDEKIAAEKEIELAASRNPITEADYTLDSGALTDAVASGRYTLEEAQAAYQGALTRQAEALDSMGVTELLKSLEEQKTPLQELDDMVTELNTAYANGVIAQDKYSDALEGIAKKRADEQKKLDDEAKAAADEANAKLRSEIGIDGALSEIEAEVRAQKTPFQLMNETIAGYRTAMEKGAIDQATFDKLAKHEQEKYLKATKDAADAAEQERRSKIESMRSESGIDSLLESLKSPWEKYLDKLDKINGYVAQGAVTAAEAQLLADKALEEAAGQNGSSQLEAAKQRAESKAVETARAGSAEVYKMQVAQANDQQAKMLAAQQQLLASSQQMALYMFRMQENIAAMASNWPRVYGR